MIFPQNFNFFEVPSVADYLICYKIAKISINVCVIYWTSIFSTEKISTFILCLNYCYFFACHKVNVFCSTISHILPALTISVFTLSMELSLIRLVMSWLFEFFCLLYIYFQFVFQKALITNIQSAVYWVPNCFHSLLSPKKIFPGIIIQGKKPIEYFFL